MGSCGDGGLAVCNDAGNRHEGCQSQEKECRQTEDDRGKDETDGPFHDEVSVDDSQRDASSFL